MDKELLTNVINGRFPEIIKDLSEPYGLLTLEISVDHIKELIQFLKENEQTNFIFLTDITAVHYPNQGNREFAVVYHLHNWEANFRLRLKVFVGRENLDVPSMHEIFSAANWMERETFDFYGINFTGHPNLKRILNMEDMDYHPMRKEYPMEDATRTDKDDRFFGRDGHEGVTFDNKKVLAKNNG